MAARRLSVPLMVRNDSGAWCGYVGVPLEQRHAPGLWEALDSTSHRGITYTGECHGTICHVPAPGEGEVFWFGFDCAHLGDLVPHLRVVPADRDVYRDVDYVRAVCERMADAAAALLGEPSS